MNEELTVAIEEIRLRATTATWFIPVRISQCRIPERSTGGGETLSDLQWVDLFGDWRKEMNKLFRAMGVSAPSEMEKYMTELAEGSILAQWQLRTEGSGELQTQ